MISQQTLNKLALGYLEKKMTLDAKETADSIIFIVSSHVKRKSSGLAKLKKLYGIVVPGEKPAEYYSTKLYNDVMSGNKKATNLFWELFNQMNNTVLTEALHTVFTECLNEDLVD